MAKILECFQDGCFTANFCDAGVQTGFAWRFQIDKLIDEKAWHQGSTEPVKGVAALLPALDGLAVLVPKIMGQGQSTRVQKVAVFQDLVILVVLSGQAQCACFDPHVDVFGHQHNFARRVQFAQCLHNPQNLVVGFALRQAHGQADIHDLGLKEQFATSLNVPGGAQRQALLHVRVGRSGKCIKRSAGLTGIARNFRHAFFMTVEFLQNNHRQVDVMLFKLKEAHGVVHQHIGVQHKQLGGAVVLFG